MALIKDDAIVLRRLDYSESSQVLVIFTRANGQQRIIAKGVKRATKNKASTGIDLLEMGSVVFSQRPGSEGTLATMTEWRQRETFPLLQRDLANLYAAQYAGEVTAQLTEVNDPHATMFDGLAAMLAATGTVHPLVVLVPYLWLMLKEIGLVPELSRCLGCGSPVGGDQIVYFSSREGGAICRDCEPGTIEKRRVEAIAVRLLSQINEVDLTARTSAIVDHARNNVTDRYERRAWRQAFEMLDYHLTETMAKQARLRAPLLSILDLEK